MNTLLAAGPDYLQFFEPGQFISVPENEFVAVRAAPLHQGFEGSNQKFVWRFQKHLPSLRSQTGNTTGD